MTRVLADDEVRARFDAALDGELSADEREAFEAALTANEALRAEYARHGSVLSAARALGARAPEVDLLPAVQHKLRARSGGRFYRDRFAERRGSGSVAWLLAIAACFVLGVSLWFAYDAGLFAR